MPNEPTSPRKSPESRLTDSPWFWAYIFSTAALIALALAAPKYSSRQTQLERRFLARQEGGQTIKGSDGQSIEPPTKDNLILRLGPLFVICGALLMVAWSRFWWTRVLSPTRDRSNEDAAEQADHASEPMDSSERNET